MELWAIMLSLKINLLSFETLWTRFLILVNFFGCWQSLMIDVSISASFWLFRAISWTLCENFFMRLRPEQSDES